MKRSIMLVLLTLLCTLPVQGKGQPPPKEPTSGAFSVALPWKMNPTKTEIVADNATGSQTNGVAVRVDSVMQGNSTALEVWLVDTTYVNRDGTAKKGDGGPYVVAWDAYAVGDSAQKSLAATGNVSFEASAADNPGNMANSAAPARPGRKSVSVDQKVLRQHGAVIVVSVYQPGTVDTGLANSEGRLARYQLTITQAPPLNISGVTVSANGKAADKTLADNAVDTPAEVAAGLTLYEDTTNIAVITLRLATPATATSNKVTFNNFVVSGGNLPPITWVVGGSAARDNESPPVLETEVNPQTQSFFEPLTPAVRADFTAEPGRVGEVFLRGEDRYGRVVGIAVSLDPGM